MAIKTKEIKLIDGTDEQGKPIETTFIITQMSAVAADEWTDRAALILGKASAEELFNSFKVDGDAERGKALVASIFNIEYEKAKPLFDQLLECCEIKVGDTRFPVLSNLDMINSPVTLKRLKIESFKLVYSFFSGGGLLNSLGVSSFLTTADK